METDNKAKEELKHILSYYREIQNYLRTRSTIEQRRNVRRAFSLAMNAHKDMRRRSGEPYIIHPLEVALIVLKKMNLGVTSVICALLHDTVEDTDYTLQDMEGLFGEDVARIIDGLTKIDEVSDSQLSVQIENFKKVLLTLSTDARAILIKIADRLHNMRTLDAMPPEKQQKIASETMYLYAPLAHRLGFYSIKSEMEDLSMKYQDPGSYHYISEKIQESKLEREAFIEDFIEPIQQKLKEKNIEAEILTRVKSVYSIWQKMNKKQIPFEEVYDLFAIRIIVEGEEEHTKSICWTVYSIVTEVYHPNIERLRDWISIPKANGYQALHTTVMSHTGKWVEVQIRSRQMDVIAENGLAAHWTYKEEGKENYEQGVESWLAKVKQLLQNQQELSSSDLVSGMKMNLYAKEIFVFTPKGEVRTLPENSKVIDFAYDISPDLGNHCIGAKINNKLAPPSQVLKTGNQVEIITSSKQKVHEEWLGLAATSKAIEHITQALLKQKGEKIAKGRNMLKEYMDEIKVDFNKVSLNKLMVFNDCEDRDELYLGIYNATISMVKVRQCFSSYAFIFRLKNKIRPLWAFLLKIRYILSVDTLIRRRLSNNPNLLGESVSAIKQAIATCCNPIAGDSVIGVMISDDEIEVHRTNCSIAIQLMARKGDKIVKAKWRNDEKNVDFLAGVKIKGFDYKGLVNNITGVIYQDFKVNCRSMNFESSEGIFEGTIMLYIHNVDFLNKLIEKLKTIEGIKKVERITSY